MKFNIVAIITIGLAFLVAAIWYSIKCAFSPEKCPKCGSLMNSRFDEKNMECQLPLG